MTAPLVCAGGLVLVLAVSAAAQTAAASNATGAQLPPAIGAAFKAAYPNATIKHVSKEKEGGKDIYEVESTDRGLARDLVYRPDGTVMSMEEALAAEEVPAPVMASLKKRYPTATITKRERVTEGATVRYELQLKGAKVGEAILNADGTFVSPK
jgi:hypothetical protein